MTKEESKQWDEGFISGYLSSIAGLFIAWSVLAGISIITKKPINGVTK